MDRRSFLSGSASAAVAASFKPGHSLLSKVEAGVSAPVASATGFNHAVRNHRFGVNYTPSHNWWFCWNDWQVDPIQRDLDAIAALGADHLRLMLVWPFFQPNLTWVSTRTLSASTNCSP